MTRHRIISLLFSCILLTGLANSCSCQKENGEPSTFLVNKVAGASTISVSADAQKVLVPVVCDQAWEVAPEEGTAASWLTYTKEAGPDAQHWNFRLMLPEWTGASPRTALFVFRSGSQMRHLTVVQAPPDGFLQETRPGLYGADGNDWIFDPSRNQLSRLNAVGEHSLRILDPASLTVLTLAAWPKGLQTGDEVDLYCRICEKGITRLSEHYPGTRVLRARGGKAWLQAPSGERFIVLL